jgi:hypothetical protein
MPPRNIMNKVSKDYGIKKARIRVETILEMTPNRLAGRIAH